MTFEFGAHGDAPGRPAAVLRLCRGDGASLAGFAAANGIARPPRFLGRDLYLVFLPEGSPVDESLAGFAAAVDRGHPGLELELVETRMVPDGDDGERLCCGPFVIAPPGCAEPGPDTIVVASGVGFGSGAHPSTRIAVELMAGAFRLFPVDSVLDAGCGTGILSLAAARLGAPSVLGVEMDGNAVLEARENALNNGLDGMVEIRCGDVFGISGKFSLVVANMTPAVLSALAATLAARARDGIVVSGFQGRAADGIAARLREAGFVEARRLEIGGWQGFLALRP